MPLQTELKNSPDVILLAGEFRSQSSSHRKPTTLEVYKMSQNQNQNPNQNPGQQQGNQPGQQPKPGQQQQGGGQKPGQPQQQTPKSPNQGGQQGQNR